MWGQGGTDFYCRANIASELNERLDVNACHDALLCPYRALGSYSSLLSADELLVVESVVCQIQLCPRPTPSARPVVKLVPFGSKSTSHYDYSSLSMNYPGRQTKLIMEKFHRCSIIKKNVGRT